MPSLINSLKQADIFFELTPDQLEMVAAVCEERRYNAGDIVFEENAASDELYVIAQGDVDIQLDPSLVAGEDMKSPGLVTIATLRRGQSFGEVALVDQGLRSATAKCAADNTQLIILPRDRLIRLCDTNPALGYRLLRNLAADLAMKIRGTDLRISEEILYGRRRQ
jgi:CRP/FNR family cyclic AMP-dependent transcriptional regulator